MERISGLTPEQDAIVILSNRLAIVNALHRYITQTPPQEVDPGIQRALAITDEWHLPDFKIPDSNV